MKYLTFALICLFGCNAYASDKELAVKMLQSAITTIVMEKYSTVAVGKNAVLGINQLFPVPQGTWKVMQQGKCYANWKTGGTDCY